MLSKVPSKFGATNNAIEGFNSYLKKQVFNWKFVSVVDYVRKLFDVRNIHI